MADPVTMAAVSVGSSLLSGAIGATGAKFSADASASSFNYKAGIAQLNSQIDKQNAAWAINSGALKASNYGLKAGQEIADTKVVQAASNLDVNSGSKEAVRDTQSAVAKYDQNTIRADAAHTAYGYETKAAADSAEAKLDIASADNAGKAGKLGILSSIIGTASSVASKWSQSNTIGIGSGSGKGSNATDGIGGYGPTAPDWAY